VTAAVSAHSSSFNAALATFGHEGLRAGQQEVIDDIFAGHPVLAVMPTGAGKSLCYQLPAVVLADTGGVTLVVSPLIALMKDQVDSLAARGVAAIALTSASSSDEQRDMIDGIRAGLYTLIYVAPERFRSPRFVDALRSLGPRLALIAIDEAHCISEWGHDFRPEYRRLGEVVVDLAPARIAAFTATATPQVRDDITLQLKLTNPRLHIRGFDRPNLNYAVEPSGGAADKARRLVDLVRLREGGVALVYAATRKNAEKYAAELKSAGMRVRVYHAGLEDNVRERNQDIFMAGKIDVIVATNAFGMGVDKSDIRLVVHADLPRSPEAYYQEAGRGGRDGLPTHCVLLFNHSDVRLQEFLIDASYPGGDLLRGIWKMLRESPENGVIDERTDDRLRGQLSGEPTGAAVSSALRILERHGMVRREDGHWVAARPEPGVYPTLDVDSLARRAQVERSKLRTMVEYAYYTQCRRQFVLSYFGDAAWTTSGNKCTGCDNCAAIANGRAVGISDEIKQSIRDILLLVGTLQGRFGRTRVANIATGKDDDERFADISEHGCLASWSARDVMDLMRTLEGAGLIEASKGEYPTISTTNKGDLVAIGKIDPVDAGAVPMGSAAGVKKSKPRRKRA
jgi:ATP-dependent DNA helicase RecQ